MTLIRCVVVVLLFLSAPGYAQEAAPPIIQYDALTHPVVGAHGMVVSREENASRAGLQMLKAGGNAVDAAVATGFALAVTHPQAGNIGGGGFMLVYLVAEDRTIAIDYREMAPKGAHRDLFLNADGDVDNRRARWSLKATGVPGTVMGLTQALEDYGTLPLKDVMAPAIRLAAKGFPVSYGLAQTLRSVKGRFDSDDPARDYLYPEAGGSYQGGDILIQADLARTLRHIARDGAKGFYEGPVADKLVATMEAGGGLITHADLQAYRAVTRVPVTGRYRGYDIVSMPPPSSGGIHVIQMLNILEGYDLAKMGLNSAAYVHRLTEAMKLAYADRSKYLGDPDYFDVPVAGLIDKAYARALRKSIDPKRARRSSDIAPAASLPYESHETTHFSTADQWGNVVASTYTLNFSFGNAKAVAGAGFLLNNEMDDFSAKPGAPNGYGLIGGVANAIAAGKRPLSSMTPTILFKDGKPVLATGSPGGSTIITVVLQMILNTVDFNLNAMAATSARRVHHQWLPDMLWLEPGFNADTVRLLEKRGHLLAQHEGGIRFRVLGSTQSIGFRGGYLEGAADPRRPGAHAAGY